LAITLPIAEITSDMDEYVTRRSLMQSNIMYTGTSSGKEHHNVIATNLMERDIRMRKRRWTIYLMEIPGSLNMSMLKKHLRECFSIKIETRNIIDELCGIYHRRIDKTTCKCAYGYRTKLAIGNIDMEESGGDLIIGTMEYETNLTINERMQSQITTEIRPDVVMVKSLPLVNGLKILNYELKNSTNIRSDQTKEQIMMSGISHNITTKRFKQLDKLDEIYRAIKDDIEQSTGSILIMMSDKLPSLLKRDDVKKQRIYLSTSCKIYTNDFIVYSAIGRKVNMRVNIADVKEITDENVNKISKEQKNQIYTEDEILKDIDKLKRKGEKYRKTAIIAIIITILFYNIYRKMYFPTIYSALLSIMTGIMILITNWTLSKNDRN